MSLPLSPSRSLSAARALSASSSIPWLKAHAAEVVAVLTVGVLLVGALSPVGGNPPAPAIIVLSLGLTIAAVVALRLRAEVRSLRAIDAQRALERNSAQLGPHFLFNALNTVNALVRDENRGEAVRAVARLGDLLRRTLDFQDPRLVTLDEEIALARDYLAWQQIRHGDALDVDVSVDAGALSARVPGMTVQLLAENAVRHGALAHGAHERVKIRIRDHRSGVRIEVENRLAKSAPQRPGLGIGTVALRQRLALAGPGTRFTATSVWGHHRAVVEIPRETKTEVRS